MLGPIFLREVLTLPRRPQHYITRTLYIGVLWVLAVTAWQAVIGWNQSATLGDQARFNLVLFRFLTYIQLTLLVFFSALSAAGSITTEKDRRTFVLLLMTDLENYEIVLGKLFGSLLQILLLLSSMVPILAIFLLLGGISGEQVIKAFVVMAGAALAAGSLGSLISLWRDKTFQALALTVLFLVLYICLTLSLGILSPLLNLVTESRIYISSDTIIAWQRILEPYSALESVLEPGEGRLFPFSSAYGFVLFMVIISFLLNFLAIWRLRVWNPSGEPIIRRETPDEAEEFLRASQEDRAKTPSSVAKEERKKEPALIQKKKSVHASPGVIRDVWENPILWREIATRAYGRRPLIVKIAYFLVVGLICFFTLVPAIMGEGRSGWIAANTLVPVSIISLLLITVQAVTAITTERDSGALNLLLVTDLSAKEFIFGKLGGIIYNAKEFLLPPLILVIFYGAGGYLATPATLGRNIEATACLFVTLVTLMAFTLVLGIHVALRTAVSRVAVINALGTVFFLSVGTIITIYLILINSSFEYQWASFILFLAAGISGLWWVFNGDRPSGALSLASWCCPLAVFYSLTNLLIGRPGTQESSDPMLPFIVTVGSFGFAIFAMLVPLLSEFDVAMGRTTGDAD